MGELVNILPIPPARSVLDCIHYALSCHYGRKKHQRNC